MCLMDTEFGVMSEATFGAPEVATPTRTVVNTTTTKGSLSRPTKEMEKKGTLTILKDKYVIAGSVAGRMINYATDPQTAINLNAVYISPSELQRLESLGIVKIEEGSQIAKANAQAIKVQQDLAAKLAKENETLKSKLEALESLEQTEPVEADAELLAKLNKQAEELQAILASNSELKEELKTQKAKATELRKQLKASDKDGK